MRISLFQSPSSPLSPPPQSPFSAFRTGIQDQFCILSGNFIFLLICFSPHFIGHLLVYEPVNFPLLNRFCQFLIIQHIASPAFLLQHHRHSSRQSAKHMCLIISIHQFVSNSKNKFSSTHRQSHPFSEKIIGISTLYIRPCAEQMIHAEIIPAITRALAAFCKMEFVPGVCFK